MEAQMDVDRLIYSRSCLQLGKKDSRCPILNFDSVVSTQNSNFLD